MQAEVVREWITYRQAEEVYALSRTTLRALVADGTIKARNVGRAVRLNRASLDAFMGGESADGNSE
jgi:excisionase family DNA binding protein